MSNTEKETQQKLDEYYKNERELDQNRPCSYCADNFDEMNKYIAWVNKLWPVKYKWIPLFKKKTGIVRLWEHDIYSWHTVG